LKQRIAAAGQGCGRSRQSCRSIVDTSGGMGLFGLGLSIPGLSIPGASIKGATTGRAAPPQWCKCFTVEGQPLPGRPSIDDGDVPPERINGIIWD